MAYIGKSPALGNFVKLDAISVVNGQAAYTMQNGSVNFIDYSTVNQFLVSLNGTVQSPGSSFTVSSSTITFSSNLSTGDVIDFIIVFGNSLSAGTVSDSAITTAKLASTSVTAAKLNNDIISGSTELASEPADTDEFLVSDAGTLKRIDYSLIKGGGLTEADQWRLSANITSSGDITSNLERPDHSGFGYVGTGMSQSSGIFTFPSTGIYNVSVNLSTSGSGGTVRVFVYQTNNNSSYNIVAAAPSYAQDDQGGSTQVFVDVTDTSQVKIKFNASSIDGGEAISGASNYNRTVFTFMKLGDT